MEIHDFRFPVIDKYLTWMVGKGVQIRMGVNSILGYGQHIFLLDHLIHYLQVMGRCTLNRVNNPLETTIYFQGWIST